MKLPAYVCLVCISLLSLTIGYAQQTGNGTIKGTVKTNDATAAAMVSVVLKGAKRNAVTNDAGSFILRNIKPGQYTLELSLTGYQSISQPVTVEENKTAEVTIQMNLSEKEMQEVIVTAGKHQYNSNKLSSSLRLNEPMAEVPQNIQVVTAAALADQQVISMSDGVTRNVSGAVRLEHWADMYTNITMRGSQLPAFRNGFNFVNSWWGPLTEDMSIVDHIEFVKGPAGFMLSNGDPSGLYNVVTKKPTGQTKGEASLTMGSFDLFRTTLDLDGKLSKDGKLLYRLNLAAQKKGSHRPYEYNDRYTVAPVISYQVDDRTKVTFEYTLQSAKMTNVGSYYVFSREGYAKYPVDLAVLPPSLEPTTINDHSVFATIQHDIDANWKFTSTLAWNNYKMIGSSAWPDTVSPGGPMVRGVGIWDAKSGMTLGQAFLNGNVTTGKVAHRILAGLDVGDKKYYTDYIETKYLDTDDNMFDPRNPYYGTPVNGWPTFDRSGNLEARSVNGGGNSFLRYTGLYAQDELGFLDNALRVTLAARYTHAAITSASDVDNFSRFTPRIGLSFNVDRNTTLYALHDEAFIPQTGFRRDKGPVKPITGSNNEIGIKRDWANGKWNTAISVYRIIKKNELTLDPTNDYSIGERFSVVLGEKKSEGFEFDLRGSIVRGLSLIANYAYTNAKITAVTEEAAKTGVKVGDAVPGFSKHTANAWLSYKQQSGVLKGAGISGGFTWMKDRATSNWNDTDKRFNLPDYFKLDGGIFWEKNKIRFTANVFNILDEYLYSGGYYDYIESYYWQTEPPRNFRFSVAYKF